MLSSNVHSEPNSTWHAGRHGRFGHGVVYGPIRHCNRPRPRRSLRAGCIRGVVASASSRRCNSSRGRASSVAQSARAKGRTDPPSASGLPWGPGICAGWTSDHHVPSWRPTIEPTQLARPAGYLTPHRSSRRRRCMQQISTNLALRWSPTLAHSHRVFVGRGPPASIEVRDLACAR
jgi:hypothetical protein